jgi:ATP-dependent Clp protease, protease subunit
VTGPPERPHIPYPFPPYRELPERKEPLLIPVVYEPAGRDPAGRLYDRRTVLLGGPLDAVAATEVAAELMSLDGRSGQAVELLVNSAGGPLEEVFAVLDVIALMRAPVAVTCFGRAIGTAAFVVAGGTGPRRATRNATISLRCEPGTPTVGSVRDAEQRAEHERTMRERAVTFLREHTRLNPERIERELDEGAPLPVATAVELGVIDEVVSRPETRPH